MTKEQLEVIRFELNEFRGDPRTMNMRDSHALILLAEVERLRNELDSHKSALALIQAIPIDAPQALARCKGYAHSTLKKWNDESEYLLK